MDQQILVNQMISNNKVVKIIKADLTDTKMEDSRRMKDQDAGFQVDDEEGKNITKHELQSEKELLEEKLKQITEKLSALQHVDSHSVNTRCQGEANDHNSQNDSSMDDKVNGDEVNNNITLNRELISISEPTSDDKNSQMYPISTETDSHISQQEDGNTLMETKPFEGAVASNQCSHDTNLKTVCSKDKAEEETIEEIIPVDHQRGLMPETDRWKLQRHTDYLVNELDAIELINKLYSQFVYDINDYELLLHILETAGRYKCVMNMLMILSRKGPNSYLQFLVALERCGYTWIIKTLEPGCVIYKGKMKYSGHKFYELIDNTSPKYKEFVKRCENNIEQVYKDKPGQQFVVVKKLEKGCVEVTFHLISLGSNDDEGLRSCLQDVVQSGFIGSDPVKSDSFTFHRITDEEISTARQSMNEKQVKDLENEIKTLKSEIIDLKVENDALKSESVHSTEIQTFKELKANQYTEKLQELESKNGVVIWSLREQLGHEKQDKDKLQEDLDRLQKDLGKLQQNLDRLQSDNETLRYDKDGLQKELVRLKSYNEVARLPQYKLPGERRRLKSNDEVLRLSQYKDLVRLQSGDKRLRPDNLHSNWERLQYTNEELRHHTYGLQMDLLQFSSENEIHLNKYVDLKRELRTLLSRSNTLLADYYNLYQDLEQLQSFLADYCNSHQDLAKKIQRDSGVLLHTLLLIMFLFVCTITYAVYYTHENI